jgi:CBS domain containing-hemolysin-like protein
MPVLWALVFAAALAESALRFASLAKLADELDGPGAKARFAAYLEEGRALSLCCMIVRVGAGAALVTLVVLRAHARSGLWGVGLVSAVGVLVLAEWLARLIGRKWSSEVLRALLPPLHGLAWPLRLLVPAGKRPPAAEDEAPEPEVVEAAKEEIRVAITDGAAEGALEQEEKEMIEGIMKFRDVDVAEIMTPRTDMECLPADMPLPAAVRALGEFPHSRVPVFEGTMDRILGIIYTKDLLAAVGQEGAAERALREVMREPLLVPETNTVSALLEQFQREHVQIAVVLDEYGGVVGLVTVEDIMEEIVGEIQDEYDVEDVENRVRQRSSGAVEVDARLRIDEVNELLGVDVPEDEDYDTIGGYVIARLARLPEPGEELRAEGLLIRVLQSDERRVRRLFLKRLAPTGAEPAAP